MAFIPFASPWWVNLLILVPIAAFFFWREGLAFPSGTLGRVLVFGLSFGIVEGAVVVYLRAATGLGAVPSPQMINALTDHLFRIEFLREAATIVMLLAVAGLAAPRLKERVAAFLAAFAAWDLAYYAFLYFAIGWPASLLDRDVLFLIPVPWLSQVWFPVLVSALSILAVCARAFRKSA